MRRIPVGAKGTYTLRVTPAHLANQFKDISLPPVFATPMSLPLRKAGRQERASQPILGRRMTKPRVDAE